MEILLRKDDTLAEPGRGWPYVSEDGSTAILFEETGGGPEETVLRIRPLDRPGDNKDIVFLDGPPCDLGNRSDCPRPMAKAQAKEINKFLLKHRWVELRYYIPWLPKGQGANCEGKTLARHFRAQGYDFTFREPHLHIARERDGALVADRMDVTVPPGLCATPPRSYIESAGIDLERRAMVVTVRSCYLNDCPNPSSYLFFRLPK